MPPDTSMASHAAIGSKISRTGGIKLVQDMGTPIPLHTGTDQVCYLDTRCPKEGWKEAPRMKSKRMWHYAFTEQGKLFVLGGGIAWYPSDADVKRVYAEVYDPSDDTAGWKDLARVGDQDGFPPSIYRHAVLDHAPSQNQRILYHSLVHGQLFYLDLGSQTLGIHDLTFPLLRISTAFLDGTLYYVRIKTMLGLFACNVFEPNSRLIPVILPEGRKLKIMSSSSLEKPIPKAHLVPLGDKDLALIWAEKRVDLKLALLCCFVCIVPSLKCKGWMIATGLSFLVTLHCPCQWVSRSLSCRVSITSILCIPNSLIAEAQSIYSRTVMVQLLNDRLEKRSAILGLHN